MTIKRRNKLPKRLKERCKKLRIRITMVRNGKRIYKTKKAILKECKKKLKRKIKRRRKFGVTRTFNDIYNYFTGGNNEEEEEDEQNDEEDEQDEQDDEQNQRNTSRNKIEKYMQEIKEFVNNIDTFRNYPINEMDSYRRNWTRRNTRRRRSRQRWEWLTPTQKNLWCFYKHISENRIDIDSMIVILFMAVCNNRQTLIAMDMLHDRKGESLSTGKKGTRELLENSLVQDNITETVIDSITTGLTNDEKGILSLCNNRFSIDNIISNNSNLKLILTDFVKSQRINKEGLRNWLITLLEDSAIKSIFKPLFENNNRDINEKFTKKTTGGIDVLTGFLSTTSFNFNNRIVTLDGQLNYKNYILYLYNKYQNIQQYFVFGINNFTLQQLPNRLHSLNDKNSLDIVKKIIPSQNIVHNIFSIIDGSNRGDTSSLNKKIVKKIHDSLFEEIPDNNPFYPFVFQNESVNNVVITKKLTISNSDFLYSLRQRPNQNNRENFFLRVGKKFNICILQGLEGKICIQRDIVGASNIGDARYILVDFLKRNIQYNYNVTPIGNVVLDSVHYYDVDDNDMPYTNQTIKDARNTDKIFIRRKEDFVTIHPYELVLEDEHISRWVCLKTNKTRKRFEKVLLGYLNNYTVNGIYRGDNNFNQQDIDGDYENFNFAAREKWESTILPYEQGFNDRKNWGIIKIVPSSYYLGSTLIPNQYIYQKSTGSFIALVWYRPRENQQNFKYMFISSDLPTNSLITDFSRVLQYNVIGGKEFHVKTITSLWNYKRILDPLQYLGLRQHLIDTRGFLGRRYGTFVTADFMCFLQTYYLKRNLGDNNITIIWEQDEDNIITTKFGTIRKNQKNIYTLIKEILEELKIETYFDFYITFNKKNKVFIRYFINPYILDQYSENTIVKKNMDKILKQLGCKSFNQQVMGKLRQMKKERVLEEQEKIKIKRQIQQRRKREEQELKQKEFLKNFNLISGRPFINSENIYNPREISAGAYGKKKVKKKTKKKVKKKRKKKVKRRFLYNPNNPKKSFDVYIDKNPKDTIPIKYTTVKDVRNTIRKLERLYKTNKYPHTRIWKVGMILKVRLEVIVKNTGKKKEHFRHAKNYFHFLGQRTKKKGDARKKMVFKFNKTYRKVS